MAKLGSTARGAEVVSYIAGYMTQASAGKVLIRDREDRLRFYVENVSRWCQRALAAMRFEIECVGLENLDLKNKNYLFVSNHMSYLDVMIFSSKLPSVFVTSVDMGEVFFLGTLAEMGGSIFVERRSRQRVDQDLSVMSETLRSGFNIVIYPEGTSTDGQKLLPFKKSLLMSAVDAGRDVVPVALKYMEIDGEPFTKANADKVCWYGDMTFADHFLGLLTFKKVKVRLEFLEPISSQPVNAKDRIRTELAEKSWHAIQNAYFADRPAPFGERREQMSLQTEAAPSATP
jgi:1-acyl-sn-glycerol-3-phosphate acyltransferase